MKCSTQGFSSTSRAGCPRPPPAGFKPSTTWQQRALDVAGILSNKRMHRHVFIMWTSMPSGTGAAIAQPMI